MRRSSLRLAASPAKDGGPKRAAPGRVAFVEGTLLGLVAPDTNMQSTDRGAFQI